MNSRKFTLVELLIVIGIIAILAGILLPVVNGAAKRADMTKAKAEITTLINAIKQFESTYGVLPLPKDYEETAALTAAEYQDLILMLQGETPGTTTYPTNPNTRKTRFLDVVGNTPGEFKDPWENNYNILMDANYDGKIVDSEITCGYDSTTKKFFPYADPLPSVTDTVFFSIVIWSEGATTDSSAKAIHNDNVYSFPVTWVKGATKNYYKITQ